MRRWRAVRRRVRRRCALIPGRAGRPCTLARRGRRPGIRAAVPERRAGLRRTLSVTQEIVALGHCWPPRGDLRQFVIAGCLWSMVDGARPEAAPGAEFRVAPTGMRPVSATSPWRRPAARSLRRLGDTAALGCGAPRTARQSVAALQFGAPYAVSISAADHLVRRTAAWRCEILPFESCRSATESSATVFLSRGTSRGTPMSGALSDGRHDHNGPSHKP